MIDHSFRVGDRVFRKAFRDCFGKDIPPVHGLQVWSRRDVHGSAPHTRITALAKNGLGGEEGATRFFAHEGRDWFDNSTVARSEDC